MPQTVKNRPAMQDTPVRSLDWEDLLEKGTAVPRNMMCSCNAVDYSSPLGPNLG